MAAHVRDRLKLRGADFTTPDSELNLDALFDMRAYLGDQADAVTISDTSGYGPALTVTSVSPIDYRNIGAVSLFIHRALKLA